MLEDAGMLEIFEYLRVSIKMGQMRPLKVTQANDDKIRKTRTLFSVFMQITLRYFT